MNEWPTSHLIVISFSQLQDMKLGERITTRRKEKNWTNEKLGNTVGVSKNLMGNMGEVKYYHLWMLQ